MNFLTDEQRTKAIASLSTAPDEVLLTCMVELRKLAHFEQGMRANVTLAFEDAPQLPLHVPDADVPIPAPVKERVNKSPGPATTTKIGTKTMDHVINELKAGDRTPDYFGTKNIENLKLLWARGKIKFDGTVYYL